MSLTSHRLKTDGFYAPFYKIKGLYFLTDQKGISLTGHWGYSEINHFILGYGKAAKEVIELREENERLKKQVDNFYNELKNTFQ